MALTLAILLCFSAVCALAADITRPGRTVTLFAVLCLLLAAYLSPVTAAVTTGLLLAFTAAAVWSAPTDFTTRR